MEIVMRHHRRGSMPVVLIAVLLAACGTAAPTPTTVPTPTTAAVLTTPVVRTPAPSTVPTARTSPSAIAAITAVPGTPASAPLVANHTALPERIPEMSTGAQSDGWILDSITATGGSGGPTSLALRFEPLPGQAGGPHADAWFDGDDSTYTIAVRGVRGSNLVLRPSEVMPLAAPLRGYYALPVRDDTIFALVIVAARPSVTWSLTASDGPGIVRLTVDA
jgi:hypothetical protein